MGMNTGSGQNGLKSEINVTPLVDVVLVLLIIFMVVTPMMSRGKSVSLPPGAPMAEDCCNERPEPFILALTSDKRLFFEEEPEVERSALQFRLRQAMSAEPSRRVVLRADESLQVGDVRTVLHALRFAGARHVLIAMEEPTQH
ncbi:ExbD/TolR family protein [Melittangium boletus]|uniref:ExbD/TolR family protein n=1 Tax=Melittangium boletus TaxID=83453 RepID=UPI003DA65185